MTGKTKVWPVKSTISPDIVRWPAVISSPACFTIYLILVSKNVTVCFFSTVTIFGDRCICRQQNSRILRWPWMRALVKWNGLEYEWKRSDTSVFRLQVGAFHFWRVASYEQRFRFKRDKLNCNLFTMFADSKCSLAAKNLCIKPVVTCVESLIYFFWSGCNQSIN